MAEAPSNPSVITAAPATQLAAAEKEKVTEHPLRKFKHALGAMLKFWPFYVIMAVIVVLFVAIDRASNGIIITHTGPLGRWVLNRATGVTTSTAATTTAASAPASAATVSDTTGPAF
jgi:hypothetical protein